MTRFYRVTLHSAHALSGDWKDGIHAVDLPEVMDDGWWMMAVESFHTAVAATAPFLVTCPTLPQGNTYSSLTKGAAFTLATVPAAGVYSDRVARGTLGLRLPSATFLRSGRLRIQLTDFAGNTVTTGGAWVMSLLVWKPEGGEE